MPYGGNDSPIQTGLMNAMRMHSAMQQGQVDQQRIGLMEQQLKKDTEMLEMQKRAEKFKAQKAYLEIPGQPEENIESIANEMAAEWGLKPMNIVGRSKEFIKEFNGLLQSAQDNPQTDFSPKFREFNERYMGVKGLEEKIKEGTSEVSRIKKESASNQFRQIMEQTPQENQRTVMESLALTGSDEHIRGVAQAEIKRMQDVGGGASSVGTDREAVAKATYGKPFNNLSQQEQQGVNQQVFDQSLELASAKAQATAGIKAVTSPEFTERQAASVQLDKLKNVFDRFGDDPPVGPLSGQALRFRMATGADLTDDEAEFMAVTKAVQNRIVKEITGAALSEAEAKRIMGQIPLETDPPVAWRAKYKQTKDNLDYLIKKQEELAGTKPGQLEQKSTPANKPTANTQSLKQKYGLE